MVNIKKLLKKEEIDLVFEKGEKIVSPFFVCYLYRADQVDLIDYLIIASKKVGIAVKRNRAKRILRVMVNNTKDFLVSRNVKHIILIARKDILKKKSTELVDMVLKKLERIGG
ncbi:MAG: ribonuclease P protein component [Candidatus Margulisiibacteriota bacterium]|nr:MAG: ribonuclease P protein component [Candidatus Margulisiibacteriota bacterium]HAR63464.1 ribonuclease P protein component [Candidatus Margulisiibacteriota bacterium]HCT85622.1 ribonuclease P protein component [Candidatus Margulisiibacteriota bacterium]HCY37336.1 ribonuclease P protein component [Candidatus Margulisiibacteriota bacterium]